MWLKHQPENQKVAGSILSQGTSGVWARSADGGCEREQIDVSLHLSLKINKQKSLKIFLKRKKNGDTLGNVRCSSEY